MNTFKTSETIGLLSGIVIASLGLSEIVQRTMGDIQLRIEANTKSFEIPQHTSHGN